MFVRVKNTPNSPRKSIQIVENARVAGKIKQKIVRYVGIAMDDREEEKLKTLALEIIAKLKLEEEKNSPQLSLLNPLSEQEIIDHHIKRKLGRKPRKNIADIIPVDQVTLDLILEEKRIIEGVHEVAGKVFNDLGFNNILGNNKSNSLLKDLVLTRISDPCSKHKTCEILAKNYDKTHELDSIYRLLDTVFDKIDAIKLNVFNNTKSLMPEGVNIVLFDVTTLHFESVEIDDLRKFGYSKNFRFNTTQVVLALATNIDGLPIGYELFEGNKAEVKTLVLSIEEWKTKFAIGEVTFIGDRAMFCEENLKLLEEKQYNYVIAAKLKGLNELMQEKILNEDNYKITTFEDNVAWVGEFKYLPEDLKLASTRGYSNQKLRKLSELIEANKERRFIVSYTSKRASKDARDRQRQLAKIDKQLNHSNQTSKLITNNAIKKYTSIIKDSTSRIDEQKIAKDAMWDGMHGIITNIKATNDGDLLTLIKKYRSLVKIEDCFRVNKTDLKMRPIYHYKPERIKAHIAICYMAFALIRQIEYRVKLTKKLSPARIIEELNGVQASIYVHKQTKDRYRVPGVFRSDARKIYQAVGLDRKLDAHIYQP
jgi:transposase